MVCKHCLVLFLHMANDWEGKRRSCLMQTLQPCLSPLPGVGWLWCLMPGPGWSCGTALAAALPFCPGQPQPSPAPRKPPVLTVLTHQFLQVHPVGAHLLPTTQSKKTQKENKPSKASLHALWQPNIEACTHLCCLLHGNFTTFVSTLIAPLRMRSIRLYTGTKECFQKCCKTVKLWN